MKLVFYIAHYCSDVQADTLFQYCIYGIHKHYPVAEIVVCSSPSEYRNAHPYESPPYVTYIESPILNSSCVGCFKDYLDRYRTKQDTKAIFLHDTMIMIRPFKDDILKKQFGFTWEFKDSNLFGALQHTTIKQDIFRCLVDWNLSQEELYGCFGFSCFGEYASIESLWNSIPFEEYMKLDGRKEIMMDLERFVGAAAIHLGYIKEGEQYSLCGDIFNFPYCFVDWYTNQTYEDLCTIPYREALVKIWKRRWWLTTTCS